MSTPALLLAVDGGGTKTQALVADLEGKVLARGLGPSSNLHNVGFERCCQAVTTAIEGALAHVVGSHEMAEGGWRRVRIAAACFGLAGVDSPADEELMSAWVQQQAVVSRFRVVNDAELILAAGTPDGWGVALISGTGSVCLGRAADGRSARVGGWGPILGDEGSGYDIAVRALRLATRSADGRLKADALLAAALRHWSLSEPAALIRRVHDPATTPAKVAGLATAVMDLASRGDAAAAGVVADAARELAGQVDAIIRRLHLQRPPLALAGGLLRGHLRRAVLDAVESEIGATQYVADPAVGAVTLARRLLGPRGES